MVFSCISLFQSKQEKPSSLVCILYTTSLKHQLTNPNILSQLSGCLYSAGLSAVNCGRLPDHEMNPGCILKSKYLFLWSSSFISWEVNKPSVNCFMVLSVSHFSPFTRLRTRQNFEPVHIIGPVQNFGPPARNFGPLRAEFAWREWRKTLGGHVANWAGLSGFSPRENKISHTFFIDFINKYSKVSNAHNSDDCHGVFNGGMLNKGWSFPRSRFDCLGLMHFFHG